MARRRMFSFEVVSSDRFLKLPATSQSFYFHLGVHADDEGFVSAPISLALLCKASDRDLQELQDAGYVIRFDSGVVLIVDWMLHNTIRKDRSVETIHRVERSMVVLVDGRYVLKTDLDPVAEVVTTKMTTKMSTNMTTETQTETTTQMTTEYDDFFADNLAPQNRIDQNIIEKNISDQSKQGEVFDKEAFEKWYDELEPVGLRDRERMNQNNISVVGPSVGQVSLYFKENKLDNIDPIGFYSYFQRKNWLDQNGKPIDDWKAMARKWNAQKQYVPL